MIKIFLATLMSFATLGSALADVDHACSYQCMQNGGSMGICSKQCETNSREKSKQTDMKCVNDCTAAGYDSGLCNNRCSY